MGFITTNFQRIDIDIQHTLDLLDELQEHLEYLTTGAPAPPGQFWQMLEGGGRKRAIDTEVLTAMCKEGMADWDMAESCVAAGGRS